MCARHAVGRRHDTLEKSEVTKALPRQSKVSVEGLSQVWDVRKCAPRIYEKLKSQIKSLDALMDALAMGCPVAPSCYPFSGEHYLRPTGHARSFCMKVPGGGYLVFKGTEPLIQDFDKILKEAWDNRKAYYPSALEHFILFEHEVYLGVLLRGALFCAEQSTEWTTAYLKTFKRLPSTPFPLAVFRLPEDRTLHYKEKLMAYLSDRGQISAKRSAEALIGEGLGVYVYYYPSIPLRAAHVKGEYPGSYGVANRPVGLEKKSLDAEKIIGSWMNLFSEMLVAGYMPTTAVHTGNCLQLQNLAVNGGFCDIDSLEKMSRIRNMKDFERALFYSISMFWQSLVDFIGFEREESRGPLWKYIWDSLRDQVRAKSKGRKCDKRLRAVLESKNDELLRMIQFLE
jgi:hypothetical protein